MPIKNVKLWQAMAVLSFAACGDDPSPEQPDAPGVDAPPGDSLACTPRGAPGDVTIETQELDLDATGTLLVHDAAGAVIDRQTFASNASVVVTVPSCGMITLHSTSELFPHDVLTWTGVHPGDRLVHPNHAAERVERVIEFTLPAVAQATGYQVFTACDGGFSILSTATAQAFEDANQCSVTATTIAVLAVAETPTTKHFAFAGDVALNLDGPTPVSLTFQPASRELATTILGVTGFAEAHLAVSVASKSGFVLPLGFSDTVEIGGERVSHAMPSLAGPGIVETILERASPASTSAAQRVFATLPAELELDATVDYLPMLSGTFADRTVTWAPEREATGDIAFVAIDIAGAVEADWTILFPGTPGFVTLPELPADLGGAGTLTLDAVGLFDHAVATSYDELRTNLLLVFDDSADSRQTTTSFQ